MSEDISTHFNRFKSYLGSSDTLCIISLLTNMEVLARSCIEEIPEKLPMVLVKRLLLLNVPVSCWREDRMKEIGATSYTREEEEDSIRVQVFLCQFKRSESSELPSYLRCRAAKSQRSQEKRFR